MEQYDQPHGCILYRTTLPPGPAAILDANEIHDFGFVYLDGEKIGITDRRNRHYRVNLPERKKEATLDILVEAMGRVNFGAEVKDFKGIHAPVRITSGTDTTELTNWKIFSFPLTDMELSSLTFSDDPKGSFSNPAFWRCTVNLSQPADTFLDMRLWGKGVVWINGHCLGRYWNIGPTQTMYVPGPWLKPGKNEFLILDLLGPQSPTLAGLDQPILNELRPDLDFAHARRPAVKLALDNVAPIHSAQFAPGAQMQEIHFDKPATGRYFALESTSALDGKPFAAIAELDLLDESGKPLPHEGWTIAYIDSEERTKEDGTAENAIDGQTASFWHTQWSDSHPAYPHYFVLDLAHSRTISGFRYIPRQGTDNVTGRIKDYRIYVGNDLVTHP